MKVVITNAGVASEEIAEFLITEVSRHMRISNVAIGSSCEECLKKGCIFPFYEEGEVSFDLESELDPYPEDWHMTVFANAFEGTGLHFVIPAADFGWTIG